jgi:hypothetical protein
MLHVLEHPRTALIVGLVLAGAGIVAPFLAPIVWAAAIWGVALLLILGSVVKWSGLLDRLPFELRSPLVKKRGRTPKPQPPVAPRGLWDYRRDADRAAALVNKTMEEMSVEMGRQTKRSTAHAKRMGTAAKGSVSVERAYELAAKAAADINKHAAAMERLEANHRSASNAMAQNFSAWLAGTPAGTDLSSWMTALRQIAQASRAGCASTDGYRQSVVALRRQNINQPLNQACERLSDVLGKIIENIRGTEQFAESSLQLLEANDVKKES